MTTATRTVNYRSQTGKNVEFKVVANKGYRAEKESIYDGYTVEVEKKRVINHTLITINVDGKELGEAVDGTIRFGKDSKLANAARIYWVEKVKALIPVDAETASFIDAAKAEAEAEAEDSPDWAEIQGNIAIERRAEKAEDEKLAMLNM